MFKSMWSVARQAWGCDSVRRRRGVTLCRSGHSLDALESRVLPAVDLVITGFSWDFLPSQTNPNGYVSHLEVTIKNAGTTTVDLAGNAHDLSDNVVIDTAFSADTNFGNNDDSPTGSLTIAGPVTDNISFPLAPNQERSFLIVAEVPTMQGVGVNYFLFKVDTTNVVAESDETNNLAVEPISPGGLAPAFWGDFQHQISAGPPATVDPSVHFYALMLGDLNGSKVTVTNQTVKPGDTLGLRKTTYDGETLRRSGSLLKLGHEIVGGVEGGKKGADLQISFNQKVNVQMLNQVMKNVTLKAKKSQTGQRAIKFEWSLGAPSANYTTQVTVM